MQTFATFSDWLIYNSLALRFMSAIISLLNWSTHLRIYILSFLHNIFILALLFIFQHKREFHWGRKMKIMYFSLKSTQVMLATPSLKFSCSNEAFLFSSQYRWCFLHSCSLSYNNHSLINCSLNASEMWVSLHTWNQLKIQFR